MIERGLSVAFVHENKVEIGKNEIDFKKYHPLTGAPISGSRKRLRTPLSGKDGKPIKFIQTKGTDNFPYFAPCMPWKAIFADPTTPIVISEGETRSLAGAAHGIPVVGCGGVDGVFMAGAKRQRLHPIFSEMVMKGRQIILCFDADAKPGSHVYDALQAAAQLFVEAVR